MPNRILKESIRTDKKVNGLTDFQFRVWAYLITYVDDFGRGSAEPDILKGFVFPRRKGVTEANIRDALTALACAGLIQIYEVDGESYLCFPTWQEHQTVRATKSKFPAPDSGVIQLQAVASNCMQMQADASKCMQVQANAHVIDTRESIIDNRESIHDQVCAPDGFDAFWEVYPRKVSKAAAAKAWKAGKLGSITDGIVADVQKRIATEWKGAEMQYIPHPATYLNQRRWEDETPPQERHNRTSLDRDPSQNPALDYQQREYTDADFGDDFFVDLERYGGQA